MTTITDINHLQLTSSSPKKKTDSSQPASDDVLSISDTSISDTSIILTNAETAALSTPDIDEAKVEAIKQAIQNGEMSINYEQLAQKMLEFELTLFDD